MDLTTRTAELGGCSWEGFGAVSRKTRSRGWQRGGPLAGRSRPGVTLQPKHQLSAPGTLATSPSAPPSCASTQAASVPELPLPFPPSLPGHTGSSFMPSCLYAAFSTPRWIICSLFCSLRHIFILTQENWGMPVGQY